MPSLFRRDQSSKAHPAEPVRIQAIATVHNRIRQPRSSGWDSVSSTVTLAEGLRPELLAEIDGFSHILVIFWMDRVGKDRPRPVRLPVGSGGAVPGILATRSQLRPNPIGVSVVPLDRVEGATLHVVGLDAIDGTPVLDIKPYIPYYDSVPAATVPLWVYGS